MSRHVGGMDYCIVQRSVALSSNVVSDDMSYGICMS